MDRLNPLNDYLFMRLMGEVGDEEQLLVFLNAVLARTHKEKLASVEISADKTFTAEVIGDKASVLDIRASTSDNSRVDIEIQLRNEHQMERRSLYYWSREYMKHIKGGVDYRDLPKVIAINIVNYESVPLPDFHTTFHIREDTHPEYVLTDALEIHFIDMVKFRRQKDKDLRGNDLHRWLTFFDPGTPQKTIEEVIAMDAILQKLQERMDFLSGDKEALFAYQKRELALCDYATNINAERRIGKDEGKIEGRIEIVSLLKSGKTAAEVIQMFEGSR
jgi:predicted transposase/invertase (TIGR01784 family)